MQLLEIILDKTAQSVGIEREALNLWLHQYPNLSPYTKIQVLRMADKYQLDPLSDEINVMKTNEGYQAFITIDGWVKLMNAHEQFAGMSFREATEVIEGIPAWMECTIYRHDRILPIIVKEYLEEVKTEHNSWQQMPRRMLRHRVIQQSIRLAFGISQADVLEKKKLISAQHPSEVITENISVIHKSTNSRLMKQLILEKNKKK